MPRKYKKRHIKYKTDFVKLLKKMTKQERILALFAVCRAISLKKEKELFYRKK